MAGPVLRFAFVITMCMVVAAAPYAEAALTCGTITQKLAPCLPYLKSGGSPAAGCCGGVKTLHSMATSTADRQAACGCLKSSATSIPGVKMGNAAALPGKCGVNIGFPVSTKVDCSKVK
uniref:Non-specific lipid-transfer protein n=1 Tax=Tamarix hispida TaxID=189793 RepID=C0KHK2_9CARY|nr:non-specific lipid-transfer protein type 1 subfamily protein [Tamarix hispida]